MLEFYSAAQHCFLILDVDIPTKYFYLSNANAISFHFLMNSLKFFWKGTTYALGPQLEYFEMLAHDSNIVGSVGCGAAFLILKRCNHEGNIFTAQYHNYMYMQSLHCHNICTKKHGKRYKLGTFHLWPWVKRSWKGRQTSYNKKPKNLYTQNICCSYPKNLTIWFYDRVMCPKDAVRMVNSVDPDQTILCLLRSVCPKT